MTLTVGSTFTGVGGADLGLEWAGFRIAWQCELDPWKRSILRAHWPEVPIFDDIRAMAIQPHRGDDVSNHERRANTHPPKWQSNVGHDAAPVDVMVGGFPCQDLSVAGKRKGFDGERSVLAFEFLRVAESLAPRWLILENVPGLLSSNRGRDFARLVDEVVACGYGVSWRVLDARYFGVPQRRRRVFLVARRADALIDSGAASRLALRALLESGSGDPTPGWPPRQDTPADAGIRAQSGGREPDVSPTVTAKWRKGTGGPSGDECQNLVSFYSHGGSMNHARTDQVSPTVTRGSALGIPPPPAVCFRKSKRAQSDQDDETWVESDSTNTLNRFDTGDTRATQIIASALDRQAGGPDDNSAQANHLVSGTIRTHTRPGSNSLSGIVPDETTIRRLTPTECEALMGWPRNHTAPEGVKAPDSKRYAACGDGIVSWVAYWIGQRIRMIEEEA